MDGLHLIFRSLDIVDRTTIADGAVTPLIIWIVVGAIGMGWQFKNIERWTSAVAQAAEESSPDSAPPAESNEDATKQEGVEQHEAEAHRSQANQNQENAVYYYHVFLTVSCV